MWEGSASEWSADSQRIVLISVNPALLASVLARLLRERGWSVGEQRPDGGPPPAAAILSADAVIDLRQVDSPLTIVLPDDDGRNGQLLRTGDPQGDPFESPREMLGTILDLVGTASPR